MLAFWQSLSQHWQSIIYQYSVGGFIFFFIIFWAIKTKALKMSSAEDRGTLTVLIVGFIFFLSVHSLWTYLVTT